MGEVAGISNGNIIRSGRTQSRMRNSYPGRALNSFECLRNHWADSGDGRPGSFEFELVPRRCPINSDKRALVMHTTILHSSVVAQLGCGDTLRGGVRYKLNQQLATIVYTQLFGERPRARRGVKNEKREQQASARPVNGRMRPHCCCGVCCAIVQTSEQGACEATNRACRRACERNHDPHSAVLTPARHPSSG